ncbi:MAG TPA: DUF2332 family protein [Streptosporangiaceae bacterium]|nr:DUF2332 family protein [Streptosporangiaceae bacterium]
MPWPTTWPSWSSSGPCRRTSASPTCCSPRPTTCSALPPIPAPCCGLRGPVPVPARLPEISWRAGLDLNPLDVANDDDMRWLSCLVWPGEGDRAQRLTAAIAAARRSPPLVHRGDLLTDLPALVAQAPADETLVIYHSAVLAYVAPEDRERFAGIVRSLAAVWFSNEAPGVVPGVPLSDRDDGTFVLARDGRQALARTDGHGDWVEWLPAEPVRQSGAAG